MLARRCQVAQNPPACSSKISFYRRCEWCVMVTQMWACLVVQPSRLLQDMHAGGRGSTQARKCQHTCASASARSCGLSNDGVHVARPAAEVAHLQSTGSLSDEHTRVSMKRDWRSLPWPQCASGVAACHSWLPAHTHKQWSAAGCVVHILHGDSSTNICSLRISKLCITKQERILHRDTHLRRCAS